MKETTKKKYPKQHTPEFYEMFGKPGDKSNHKVVTAPYPLKLAWDKNEIVTKIRIHKLLVYDVLSVLERVKMHYGNDIEKLFLDLYGGSYSYRATRHGDELSMHAWAAALDFDPEHNKLRWGSDKALFAQPEYDFWWKQWEKVGWTSLGKERNYDFMHIQAAKI